MAPGPVAPAYGPPGAWGPRRNFFAGAFAWVPVNFCQFLAISMASPVPACGLGGLTGRGGMAESAVTHETAAHRGD